MVNDKNIYSAKTGVKPNLDKGLFWDWRYNDIDWQKTYRSVIERVLERGTRLEWEEIIRFYGMPKIVAALKDEIKFLPEYILEEVSTYFGVRKEEMACFITKGA